MPKIFKIYNFLQREEISKIVTHILEHRDDFQHSGVKYSNGLTETSGEFRKSTLLYDVVPIDNIIKKKIEPIMPLISNGLQMEQMTTYEIECQIAMSGNDDFFKIHRDAGDTYHQKRKISFVYFIFKTPKSFYGGTLRIYDFIDAKGIPLLLPTFESVEPVQNLLVCFPSLTPHEVLPVYGSTEVFKNGRFTLVGWISGIHRSNS